MEGAFELIASPLLLAELEQALAYPKLRQRIPAEDADRFVRWLERSATLVEDPRGDPPVRSSDPDDDYLLRLAASQPAALVSGDRHLLELAEGELPIFSPSDLLDLLAQRS